MPVSSPINWAPGNLAIARHAHGVGTSGANQLFFVLSYHRDFRNRIDPEGQEVRVHSVRKTKGMARRMSALLHRR